MGRNRMFIHFALAVAVGTVSGALACILDGTSQTIVAAKPPLPGSSDASHANSWVENAAPVMMESDGGSGPGSNDDSMGPAVDDPNTGTASGVVTNSGGDLFGPRGGDQNGFGEGPGIEVKICWKYKNWVPTMVVGFGNETLLIPGHYEWAWACSTPVDVKPC